MIRKTATILAALIIGAGSLAAQRTTTITARQVGGTTYFSNGVTARQAGGTTYYSNGMTARQAGGTTYYNNVPTCPPAQHYYTPTYRPIR